MTNGNTVKRSPITLKDFLLTATGEFTYVNTKNSSFPEKYQSEYYYYASLFVDIIKQHDEDLFNRRIKSIEIDHKRSSSIIITLDDASDEANTP